MENVKVKIEGKEFKPFTIKMEIKVNTLEDLKDMREEFTDGKFADECYSDFSILIGNLLEKLHETLNEI